MPGTPAEATKPGRGLLGTSAMARTVDGYLFAEDPAKAAELARSTGEPVESVADRTERVSMFHLPDGTVAFGESSAVQWVRAEDAVPGATQDVGGWVPVDATLVEVDGVVRPRAVPGDVVVSAGGEAAGQDLVVVTAPDGTRQSLGWGGPLPEPVLDGPRAIYPDAAGTGTDLILEAGVGGVEAFFVVRERPLVDVELPVQVASEGGVRSDGAGGLELLGVDGEVAASMAEPLMWDVVADGDRPHPVTQPWEEMLGSSRRTPAIPDWGGVSDEAAARIAEAAVRAQDGLRTQAVGEQSAANLSAGWSAVEVEEVTSPVERVAKTADAGLVKPRTSTQGVQVAPDTDDVVALQAAASSSARAESDATVPVGFDVASAVTVQGAASMASATQEQMTVQETGESSTGTAAGAQRVQMVLRPDMAFLADPSNALPLVIDPGMKWEGVFDTWVQSDSSVDKSGDAELRLGTFNGGATVARSYLGPFDTTRLVGNQVLDGHLALWEWHSYSCSAAAWEIGHTGHSSSGSRWNAQPAWHSIQHSSTDTRGYSASCGDGWVGISLTTPLQWASNNAYSMSWGIKAVNESSSSGWKRFNSANASSGWPYMWVNVADRAPSAPVEYRMIDPSVTTCVTSGTYPAISATQPTIAWKVSDPDAFDSTVIGNLDIVEIDGNGNRVPGFAWDMEARPEQGDGTTFTVKVPAGKLFAGKRYEYRTGGQDVDSGAYGPMSGCRFTVDATKPAAPGVEPSTASAYGTSELPKGQTLSPGRQLVSKDGRFRLAMQTDGNLVAYGPSGWYWQTDTDNTAANRLVLQGDGNLVLYSAAGPALWHTGTNGRAVSHLGLGNDGRLVLFNGTDEVWRAVTPAFATSPGVKPVNVLYARDVERGGVGVPGRFKLSTTEADVVRFDYSFDTTTYETPVHVDTAGNAIIDWSPTSAGPHTLHVRAVDVAGNWQATAYEFDVAAPVVSAVWSFDESSGDAVDQIGEGGKLTLQGGATRGQGPHALFGVRSSDRALVLDGVDDFAVADQPVTDTRQSFTVAAFVKLDASDVGTWSTAVIQEDLSYNGFRLGYRPYGCPAEAGTGGCWAFGVNTNPAIDSTTYVNSKVSVRPDTWVLLVGEHDAGADEVRISVCEIGTPQAQLPGDVFTEEFPFATPQTNTATGRLVVGRGQIGGAATDRWGGSIDAVRVYDGQVLDPAKVSRICTGAEEAQFPAGMTGAVDPTVLDEEVGQ